VAQELLKMGHEITVVTEQYSPDLALEETIDGIRIKRLPYPAITSKLGVWKYILKNKKFLQGLEIVQVHDVYWWLYPLVEAWQKRYFITFHGYESDPIKTKAIIQRRLINKITAGAMGVGSYIESAYGTPLTQITYGAAKNSTSPLPLENRTVFVGRLEFDTGIIDYLQLMKYLPRDFTLDVFGSGKLQKQVIHLIKDYSDRVKYHGICVEPERVIKAARHVFASQYLTILEAMQQGRIVWSLAATKLKTDYLNCHPQRKNLLFGKTPQEIMVDYETKANRVGQMTKYAQEWAVAQTPNKLAKQYLKLWGVE
jgi:glycosyltransferase involved in cell wall biosynthesis